MYIYICTFLNTKSCIKIHACTYKYMYTCVYAFIFRLAVKKSLQSRPQNEAFPFILNSLKYVSRI